MKDLEKFPERLKELMFDRDQIGAEELAEEIGVYPSTVRMWMKGGSLITLENARKLADFFGCSLDYLAGTTEHDSEVAVGKHVPFYDRLRAVMKERGVSRYRISKSSEIKDVYFTRWSRGATPDLITVIKLADFLNVSLDDLVGRTD